MKRIFSAGGIVFNDQGEVLICKPTSHDYWIFPKGKVEEGETPQITAIREVEEEGGVKAEVIDKIGYSKYIYSDPKTKEKFFKIVTYFLMKYLSGDHKLHDWEMEEVIWLKPEEATQKLSFEKDRDLLKKALQKLKKHAWYTLCLSWRYQT